MDEVKSVCRLCAATCGVTLKVEDGRVLSLLGDRDHPLSKGYMCPRGLAGPAAHNSAERILRPLKRMPDGSFREIALETALDEIAAKLRNILDESGPEAVALFKGTQSYKSVTGNMMLNAWSPTIGSTRLFTTITIDQSAKQVTMRRMGYWDAGKHRLDESDVLLVFGSNPLVSMTFANLFNDPTKRLKGAIKRGMTLIVVDPRRTETAGHAQLFLQPVPGQDPAIAAAMLRLILERGWHDRDFCDRYVSGLDRLRAAVDPFTLDHVARRTGVPAEDIEAAARLFALEATRGIASAGTGPSMSRHSNLADHMIESLNVVCGRYPRGGEPVPNPGVQSKRRAFRAEVVPPFREWERSPKTGTGHGTLFGELMSGVLADELLREDEGRIRALFVHGGNPAAALPDQRRAVAALAATDLLVAVEPFMTVTAKLCSYILPPRMIYERTDTAIVPHYEALLDMPFAQYAPAVVPPPAGSEVVEDWYPYWALAKRLGLPITYAGQPLDMTREPSTDDLLGIILRDAQVPFAEIKPHVGGHVFDVAPAFVEAPRPEVAARFDIMPDDVADDLQDFLLDEAIGVTATPDPDYPFLLAVRRLRGMVNSLGIQLAEVRRRHPYNALYMHGGDAAALGAAEGAEVELRSEKGGITAIVEIDDTMRPGVVSISHCWGDLPDAEADYRTMGASTNLLTRTDAFVEAINAMPQMSAIPVAICVVAAATA